MSVEFLPLKPEAAIKFFEKKGYKIGFDWRDVWKEEHAIAFTVAKAANVEILQEIRNGLQQALENGTTFEEFKKNLKPYLADKGWWGKKMMKDPITGEDKEVQLGSTRRLSIIYDTNMRMSYAAGHWQSIEENASFAPWLRYVTVMDGRQREEHAQWHNLVLPYNDPFWSTHYPPNGWKCRCTVNQLSDYDLKQRGLTPSKSPEIKYKQWENTRTGKTEFVPEGIAPGFDYNVGKSRLKAFTPPPDDGLPQTFQNRVNELPPIPKASPLPKNAILPDGLSDEDYARAFLNEFGADIGKPTVFKDIVGEPLVIDESLFIDKKTGKLKSNKRLRGVYLKLMADVIKNPDEIWLMWGDDIKNPPLRRRYIKLFETPEGSHGLAVFEKDKIGWRGVTTFPAELDHSKTPPEKDIKDVRDGYINDQRNGFLAYKKKQAK